MGIPETPDAQNFRSTVALFNKLSPNKSKNNDLQRANLAFLPPLWDRYASFIWMIHNHPTMTQTPSYPNLIRQLLQSKTVMTLKEMRHELASRPRSSLFRDLQKVEILTSYSHAGQYHALQSTVNFKRDGLWFYDHIAFSRHGTLKNTDRPFFLQ